MPSFPGCFKPVRLPRDHVEEVGSTLIVGILSQASPNYRRSAHSQRCGRGSGPGWRRIAPIFVGAFLLHAYLFFLGSTKPEIASERRGGFPPIPKRDGCPPPTFLSAMGIGHIFLYSHQEVRIEDFTALQRACQPVGAGRNAARERWGQGDALHIADDAPGKEGEYF